MARRERGSGSISQRKDGTWTGYVTLPGPTPTRRHFYQATKSDAKAELERLLAEQRTGKQLASRPDRTTVPTYLTNWLAGAEVRPNTRRQYDWIVTLYLAPRLIGILLSDFDTAASKAFLRELRKDDPGDRTRQLCYDVLRIALNAAVAEGLITANPLAPGDRPLVERRDMTPWIYDEAEAVIEASRGDRFHALYVVELRLGLQIPGEIFGLRWDLDVDLKARTIRVGGQFARGRWAPTKTDARRRLLVMPNDVHAALAAHRERLFAEGLRSSIYVFPNQSGNVQNYRHFKRSSFDPIVKRAGVRPLRPYDMRHSAATIALTAGVNIKTVSRMLGHASEIETLRTYAHFLPTAMADANELIDAYWSRGRAAKGVRES